MTIRVYRLARWTHFSFLFSVRISAIYLFFLVNIRNKAEATDQVVMVIFKLETVVICNGPN